MRYPRLTSPSWRVRDFGVWRGRAGVCSQAGRPRGEGREPGGGPRSETVAPALRGRGLFVASEEKTWWSIFVLQLRKRAAHSA